MCILVFSEAAALAIDDSGSGILTKVLPCFFVVVIAIVISTHIVYIAQIVQCYSKRLLGPQTHYL